MFKHFHYHLTGAKHVRPLNSKLSVALASGLAHPEGLVIVMEHTTELLARMLRDKLINYHFKLTDRGRKLAEGVIGSGHT